MSDIISNAHLYLVMLGMFVVGMAGGMVAADVLSKVGHTSQLNIETIEPAVNTTPIQEPVANPYVMCSEYSKVTDKYKTVKGNFVVVQNETEVVDDVMYSNITLLGYVKADMSRWGGYVTLDDNYARYHIRYEVADPIKTLTPVTEQESGYRDACVVTR